MTNTAPLSVVLNQVSKHFAGLTAVDNASFAARKGEFLTILGPSGCGKTTLLRMIAGFIAPTSGEILLNDAPVAQLPPHRRSIGMVFQKLALFPHMTAAQNITYPLKMRGFKTQQIPERVQQYLALVKLEAFAQRYPHELSGGQQQRVAIARALVFSPDLLLLDEPLSALDKKLREEMQLEFRRIQQELGVTTINVTHDQREALVMSDKIVVMNEGVIQQAEDPVSLYRAPSNRFVAGFIGLTSFLPGTAGNASGQVCIGDHNLHGRPSANVAADTALECAIRAEQVRICAAEDTPQTLDYWIDGQVQARIFEGDRVVYEVHCPTLGNALVYAFDHDPMHHHVYDVGTAVKVGWNADDLMIFV